MPNSKEKKSYDNKALDEYILKVIKKFARDGFKTNTYCTYSELQNFLDIFCKDKGISTSNLSKKYRFLAEKIFKEFLKKEKSLNSDSEDKLYYSSECDDDCYILSKNQIIGENKLKLSCLSKSQEYLYIMHVAWIMLHIKETAEQINIPFSSISQEFGANMEDWNTSNSNLEHILGKIIAEKNLFKLDDVKLENYEICRGLWAPGAFGTVCLAYDESRNLVAFKKISHNKHGFLKELESVLFYRENFNNHPNLIKILSIGVDEDFISDDLSLPVLFYTMEVADDINDNVPFGDAYYGMTLSNLIQLIDRIKVRDLFIILEQLLNGVKFLHDHGAAHRDIKPDNILFVDGIPKLADVGLVSSHEVTMSLAGTPGFLPQEHMEKIAYFESPDQRMDLYALGMTAYCCFTGFSPEKYPEVPFELLKSPEERKMNKIILKACAKEPSERFQTADEFIAALND